MSRGPLPSQLCLLSDLPTRSEGDKVRFLGCVKRYSTATACLTLEHEYPNDSSVVSLVDVSLVLETITAEQTRVGEWVNVTGYVTAAKPHTPAHSMQDGVQIPVQALLLWSAGPLDLQRYEHTLSVMNGHLSGEI